MKQTLPSNSCRIKTSREKIVAVVPVQRNTVNIVAMLCFVWFTTPSSSTSGNNSLFKKIIAIISLFVGIAEARLLNQLLSSPLQNQER